MTAAITQTKTPVPWWLVLIEGIAVLVLGALLLTSPAATAVILVTFLGAYFLVSGIFNIVAIFTNKQRKWYWSLLIGILGIIAGLAVLEYPVYATMVTGATLTIMIGVWALMMGILYLIKGFQGEGVWSIILGIVDIIIGLWLLTNIGKATLSLPWAIGFLAIIGGIALIFLAFKNK
jgi:uncharacterized membrane protein HdeD (DUF308 family)